MNIAPVSPDADLRQRERVTAAMVAGIEKKIQKLTQARADRLRALAKIRTGLAREILHGHGTPTCHENTR
jgi:hypothetical protein